MKKHLLILSVFILIVAGSASAQTEKGQMYIGGYLNISYNGNGTTTYYPYTTGFIDYTVSKTTIFQFSPEIGYFLSNKWSLGIRPNFSHSSGTESSYYYSYSGAAYNGYHTDTYNLNYVGIGITLRYYWMLSNKFGIFPKFEVSTSNNVKEFSYGIITVGGNANAIFFPTPKLGLIMGFGDLWYGLNYKTKISTFNFDLNNNFTFGVNYYWGRK